MKREQYEWANLWWEEASDNESPRVLLIGDSISVGYRPWVQQRLGGVRVDLLATSKAVDDPAFFKELRYMLGEYPYRAVHFNNGLHGGHLDDAAYERGCAQALTLIAGVCPRIIAALSTPVTIQGRTDCPDPLMDTLVRRRNSILGELAQARKIPVNDLYTPMLGHPEYRQDDGYHYLDSGRQAQAGQVAEYLAQSGALK